MEIGPGAFHLKHRLTLERQREVRDACVALIDGDVPAYVPTVRGGGKMHVRMLCLGRHWNGKTYRYEPTRSDFDNQPAPALPAAFRALAQELAADAGMAFDPDLCILNYYEGDGRMGLHQDKDESPESIAAGLPVVSVSIGDTARFLFGGTRRKDPVEVILLESGDAFVFGGAGAAALSRRLADLARHSAAGARAGGPVQPDVPSVLMCNQFMPRAEP